MMASFISLFLFCTWVTILPNSITFFLSLSKLNLRCFIVFYAVEFSYFGSATPLFNGVFSSLWNFVFPIELDRMSAVYPPVFDPTRLYLLMLTERLGLNSLTSIEGSHINLHINLATWIHCPLIFICFQRWWKNCWHFCLPHASCCFC